MESISSISSSCSYISSIAAVLILVFPNLLPQGETQDRVKRMRSRIKRFRKDKEEDGDSSEGGRMNVSDSSLD